MKCSVCGKEVHEVTEPKLGPIVRWAYEISVPFARYECCGRIWTDEAQRARNVQILKRRNANV